MLKNELSNVEYEDITINVLEGNSSMQKSVIDLGKTTIEAEDISIRNLNYSSYFFDGEIVVDKIIITRPRIVTNKKDTIGQNKSQNEDPGRNIKIHEVLVKGGSYSLRENEEGKDELYLSLDEVRVFNIEVNNESVEGQLPFTHERFIFKSDSLFMEMNEEHNIAINSIKFDENDISIDGFEIIPKYPKEEFDRNIPYEKDRVELLVKNIDVNDLEWTYENDSLSILSPGATVAGANLQVYRNKLLPDDDRIKPLYSRMLREMGIKLSIDSIGIEGSEIVYEEKVSTERPPGKLTFTNVSGSIKELTNINLGREDFPTTKFEAEALFAGEARFTVNLEFKVNDENDRFNVSGSFAGISADEVNSFLIPAMNVKVEGEIESMFYNFAGDSYRAAGDMQLAYRDFKVSILKDGEEKRKGFLSGLANLILKNDVVDDDVSQESIEAERDRTKSFWNYLWRCIRNGAVKTLL